MSRPILEVIGAALRRARRNRGLTLRDVEHRSRGRFKATSVAGYERGERSITIERFCDLATVYGVPPAKLLVEALRGTERGTRDVVIDLNRLAGLGSEESRAVAEHVHTIRSLRDDYLTDVITLRGGDLEVVASSMETSSRALLSKIREAIRPEQDSGD